MIFGSDWAWLISENGKHAVTYATYHDTPLLKNQIPLLTIDCWEHVYYLDFQNRKGDYIDAYINKLANWQFAQSNMAVSVAEKGIPAKSKK